MSELAAQPFDFARLRAAYAAGASPEDVIAETYRRIESVGDPGIFIHLVDRGRALDEARALGPFDLERRPLFGLPFAIKDNIDAAGMPTTAACPAFTYAAESDAFVVALLRAAGAILIGKTNLDQFATGLVGMRTPFPPPRNAIDPALVPGGSSAGSGVAVAHGLVSFALGTDTAGSGRVPAALNNVVGFKPTLGALSTRGVVPACRTLDAVSVFALTVEDAHEVLRVGARFDVEDPFARPLRSHRPTAMPAGTRVGVADGASREFFGDHTQAACYDLALGSLCELGCELVPLDLSPFVRIASLLYDGAWVAERYAVVERLLERTPDALHPVTRTVIERGRTLTAVEAFRDRYRLETGRRAVAPLLERVDVLCVPSTPTCYTRAEVEADPIGTNTRLGHYTNFVNLLDLCGVATPVAPRTDGRAGSVTLLARAGRDAAVAALASALHRRTAPALGATGWSHPDATVPRPVPDEDEIVLAVVGAHMTGLPLNSELTRLGARYLCAARTAPRYRLFRLAGGPPHRPGLVRDARGAAIALELWALPRHRLGDLVERIPPPLGIGTLTLDDGRPVHGFICESAGTTDAEEITAHGGWRAYLATASQG